MIQGFNTYQTTIPSQFDNMKTEISDIQVEQVVQHMDLQLNALKKEKLENLRLEINEQIQIR